MIGPSRKVLIRTLWPDKSLYGAVMLFVTGLSGLLWGLIGALLSVTYSNAVPEVVQKIPPAYSVLPAGAAMIFAYLALQTRRLVWAALGCLTGLLSLSGLGFGPLLSLIALGFVLKAYHEREFTGPRGAAALPAEQWPDKSLAASLLSLVVGVLSLLWGAALLGGVVTWVGLSEGAYIFGSAAVVAGLLNVLAAHRLYHQRDPDLGSFAAIAGVIGFGFLLLAPILSAANLVLIRWAKQEGEFEAPADAATAAKHPAAGEHET